MRKWMTIALLLVLALMVTGCGKAPAQAALTAADEAIANVKPEAEKYVPEEFAKLTAAAADARAKFDAGNYKDALTAAKDIPTQATEVLNAANAKKEELTGKWNELQGSMPAMVQGLTDKVSSLEAMKKLPRGFDKTQLETAKASLASVTSDWTAAADAFKSGDVTGALSKAEGVKSKAEELAKSLEAAAPAAAKK
ncbi:MAG TPA: hypothetical protein VFO89_13930 [Thermoanaerobaculia bacterium]|nr:hypothetical protein [Thermoanaerobaculia bacterium]